MTNSYVGFKVEITSSQMGKIVGIVSSVTEKQIELSDAVVNNCSSPVSTLPVECCFIERIRFLSAVTSDSSDTATPQKDETVKISTRARRREMLRNIPNTYTAYVCPDSPPLIHKTMDLSPNRNLAHGASGLQQLDAALAKVSFRDSTDNRPPKNRHYGTGTKRRSLSMSEAAYNSSDVSGTESDAFHRHNNHPHYHHNNHPYHPNNTGISGRHGSNRPMHHSNSSNGSNNNNNNSSMTCFNSRMTGPNRSGVTGAGGPKHQQTADWDRIRVEEFIDEDFDFEGNLALFDKNAFYEMVNLREGNPTNNRGPDSNTTSKTPFHLVEGPDGVGVPLLDNFQQKQQRSHTWNCNSSGKSSTPVSNPTPIAKSNLNTITNSTQSNQSTNLLTTLISGRSNQTQTIPGAIQPSPSIINNTSSLNISSSTNTGPLTPAQASQQQSWYTQIGQRVPIYTSDTRNRLVHYLANGIDCSAEPVKSPSTTTTMPGAFSWGRIIEAAGRSIVDHYTNYHRQSYRTPQHIVHRPPARILILPNGTNLSGSLALAIARNLAIRGACVLISDPNPNQIQSANLTNFPSSVYETELDLLGHLAPKPNRYGLDSDEDPTTRLSRNQTAEQLDEDEEVENLLSIGPNQSGLGGSFDLSQSNQIVDYGPVSQIWMSRMPGFKLLRRPTSIFKLPNNIQIDLVIMGYPNVPAGSTTSSLTKLPCDPIIAEWLTSHSALGLMIHLLPDWPTFYQSNCILSNARFNWIMELGLPIIQPGPIIPTDSRSSCTSPTDPNSKSCQSHVLVDIGLGRNLVRRIIGDLKSLPPYGLFDLGSIAELHSLAKPDQQQQLRSN